MHARRRLLALAMLGAAQVLPLHALGQPQRSNVRRVGFLFFGSRSGALDAGSSTAFVDGMRELGYVEGKNLVVDWRFAEGSHERVDAHAADMVRARPEVIVAASAQCIRAAKQATTTIPIVMVAVGDPISAGFVTSLSRPGGNITGLSNIAVDIGGKYLELLDAALPKVTRVAVLTNRTHPLHPEFLRQMEAAAGKRGVQVVSIEASGVDQLASALGALARQRTDALIVAPDPFFMMQRRSIAQTAMTHRMPTMFWTRDLVRAGGLMSDGQNLADHYRRAASYVDKLLKGAKPGDLPIEQPTKLELVINASTAKAIGLTLPRQLILLADEVID